MSCFMIEKCIYNDWLLVQKIIQKEEEKKFITYKTNTFARVCVLSRHYVYPPTTVQNIKSYV